MAVLALLAQQRAPGASSTPSCLECLSRVAKALQAAPYVTSLKLIDTAKVPVLKLAMSCDGVLFNVDVTVDGQAVPHSGLVAL